MSWPEAFFYSVIAVCGFAVLSSLLDRVHQWKLNKHRAEVLHSFTSELSNLRKEAEEDAPD